MSETHSIRLNIDASAAKTGATQYVSAINKITKATEAYQSALTSIGKSKATGDFSRIATAMGKLNAAKVSPSLAKNINELSSALSGFRGPSKTAVRNAQSFFNMINAAQIRPGRASQIAALTGAMQGVRGPSRSSVGNITAFLNAVNNMTVDSNKLAGVAGLTSVFAGFKGPSKSAAANIDALVNSLNRLQVPKNIGNLTAPLQALAAVSASSARAVRNLAATQAGAANSFRTTGQSAIALTGNMRGLENAMSLSYQAGSQLRVLFGSLTFAEFTRGVYNATLAVEKFNTVIGITAKSQQEFQSQINFANTTADKFGISLSGVYDEYGKFTTAAQLAGQTASDTQSIFASLSGAMRVLGTDAQGQQRVFKALTQIFSKGGVYAEEIRQQIGEQFSAAFNLLEQSLEDFTGKDINLNKMLELGQIDDSAMLIFANKVREVMGPQLAKALDRADAKVGRLANSWFKFQVMVGKAGVMDAIGDVAQQLTDALESPAFQSNAQGIAEGIAKGIRALGDAAVWATEHVRELGAVLMGFMASSVVANIAKVGGAIGSIFLGLTRGAGPLRLIGSLFLGLPAIIGGAVAAVGYFWNEEIKLGDTSVTVGNLISQAFYDAAKYVSEAWDWIKKAAGSTYDAIINFSWSDATAGFHDALVGMGTIVQYVYAGITGDSKTSAELMQNYWVKAFREASNSGLKFFTGVAEGLLKLGYRMSAYSLEGIKNAFGADPTETRIFRELGIERVDERIEAAGKSIEAKIAGILDITNTPPDSSDVSAEEKSLKDRLTAYGDYATEMARLRANQEKAEVEARERAQKLRAEQEAKDLMGAPIDVSNVNPFRNMDGTSKAKDSVGKRAKAAAQAMKDYTAEVADLNQMLQNGVITLEQFNQGLEYQARKLQESSDPYAAMVRSMEDELQLSGMASKAREVEIAHREKINDLAEKGVHVTQEMSDKIRKLIEAQNKMNNQPLRDWVDGIEDIGVATDKVAVNAMEGLADQISELVVTGKADFASLAQSILKEFIKVGINQLYKQMFGGMFGGTDSAKQGTVSTPIKSLQEAQNLSIGATANSWEMRGTAGKDGAHIPEVAAEAQRKAALDGLVSSSDTLRGSLDIFSKTVDGTNVKIEPLNTNIDTMTTSAINASQALDALASRAGALSSQPTTTGDTSGTASVATAYAPATTAKQAYSASTTPYNASSKELVLSQKEITDLKKTLMTEVDAGLNGAAYDAQAAGVVDTILNRKVSGKWGNSITDVVNSKSQFSDINGAVAWKKGRRGVDDISDSVLSSGSGARSSAFVDKYLAQRMSGRASSVGGHLNYANPNYSDASNRGWIDKLQGPTFGEGSRIHKHGTTAGYTPVDPNYAIRTAGSATQQPIPVAIDKVGTTGISNGNVFSKLIYSNQNATRSMKVDPALEKKIQEAVGNVYGKDYTAEIYSGGQGRKGSGLARIGTTRHDDGEAADIYVRDPQGNKVRGDGLAPLGQYWQAKGYGGTGMEMRGGGVHLDQHTDRARTWNYANQGGQFTNAQAQALQAGQRGIMPTLNGQQGIDPTATAGIQQVNDQLKQLGSTAQQTASVTQTYAAQEQATSQQNIMMQQQKMMADQQSGMAIMNAGSNASQASPQFQQAGQAIQQAGQQAAQGAQQALGQLGSLAGMIPGAGPYVGMASQILGLFEEGGLATKPVQTMSVPHYKEGTANTSGGMPAVLHPNEAVIPLSRGRKVPVELDSPRESDNTSDFSRARAGGPANITMVLNGVKDGDSFKRSKRQVETMYSSALRRQAERDT